MLDQDATFRKYRDIITKEFSGKIKSKHVAGMADLCCAAVSEGWDEAIRTVRDDIDKWPYGGPGGGDKIIWHKVSALMQKARLEAVESIREGLTRTKKNWSR